MVSIDPPCIPDNLIRLIFLDASSGSSKAAWESLSKWLSNTFRENNYDKLNVHI